MPTAPTPREPVHRLAADGRRILPIQFTHRTETVARPGRCIRRLHPGNPRNASMRSRDCSETVGRLRGWGGPTPPEEWLVPTQAVRRLHRNSRRLRRNSPRLHRYSRPTPPAQSSNPTDPVVEPRRPSAPTPSTQCCNPTETVIRPHGSGSPTQSVHTDDPTETVVQCFGSVADCFCRVADWIDAVADSQASNAHFTA